MMMAYTQRKNCGSGTEAYAVLLGSMVVLFVIPPTSAMMRLILETDSININLMDD